MTWPGRTGGKTLGGLTEGNLLLNYVASRLAPSPQQTCGRFLNPIVTQSGKLAGAPGLCFVSGFFFPLKSEATDHIYKEI